MQTSLSELINLLCSELAEAALDAQRLQLAEINAFAQSLDASDEQFAARYIDAADVEIHSIQHWGFDIFDDATPGEELYEKLISIKPDLAPIAVRGRLRAVDKRRVISEARLDALHQAISDRRALLRSIVERNEMPRIFVESGELSVRLNLSIAAAARAVPDSMKALMTKAGMKIPQPMQASRTRRAGAQSEPKPTARVRVIAAIVPTENAATGQEASLNLKFKAV